MKGDDHQDREQSMVVVVEMMDTTLIREDEVVRQSMQWPPS